MPGLRALLGFILVGASVAHAATHVESFPVPPEMRSSFFAVTVNGQRVDVAHAASNYEYVNFDATGPVEITITAAEPHFWDWGADVEPWRLGLRATRTADDPQTIRFRLNGPAKLAISRPEDFLNRAHMLFLFANTPAPPPPSGPNVTIVPAGVHRESLNPKSGDTIYLAPGAYIFGALNLWQVHDVKVLGRGTIVYDGAQDPNGDTGWMQKPDWHCIVAFHAQNVEIDGLTCLVRSRTWSIQMKDSTGFTYDDVRVMGGNPANANQDGMDFLGSGDAVVKNSFIRSSDDDLAMVGNWDGYTHEAMVTPGADVNNIIVENTELSTSISNIVRLSWPQKVFNSRGFTLRNSDILEGGIGACGQTFGLLGLWGANGARGDHSDVNFENLFVDHWYSLEQIEQEQPVVHGVTFRNIWVLGQPPLAESTITGDVHDVTFENVKYGQTRVTSEAQVPVAVTKGAERPKFSPAPAVAASFAVTPAVIAPGEKVTFTAQAMPGARYTWLFGDGTSGQGRIVRHRFPDAVGTELDGANGAGLFRVLLHVTDSGGHQDWAAQGVVVVDRWHDAAADTGNLKPGLDWKIYAGGWRSLPDFGTLAAALTGNAPNLEADAQGFKQWATVWDGFLKVPADGGYTFSLMDRDGARLEIDGAQVAQTGPAFAQVCGSPGNAVRYAHGAIGLRAGWHRIHVEALNTMSGGAPRLLWEGPGIGLQEVPATVYGRK